KHLAETLFILRPGLSPAVEDVGQLEWVHGVQRQTAHLPVRLLGETEPLSGTAEGGGQRRLERMQEAEAQLLEKRAGRKAAPDPRRARVPFHGVSDRREGLGSTERPRAHEKALGAEFLKLAVEVADQGLGARRS